MSAYEIIEADPLDRLTREIEGLKKDLKILQDQLKNSIEEIRRQVQQTGKLVDKPVEEKVNTTKQVIQDNNYYIYRDLMESLMRSNQTLIKSNIDLQAKISELVVISSNLYKELRELIEIFKEAALIRSRRSVSGINEEEIQKRLETLEKSNLKLAEMIDSLKKTIENIQGNKISTNLNQNIRR
ncbi:MAG: hypothetical protein ACP5G1_03990 [Nanopusillaceae archaeon]